MIMQARLKAGWVTEAELAPPPARKKPGGTEAGAELNKDRRKDNRRCWQRRKTASNDSELDRGAISVAAGERTCALTRDLKPVSEMIRFVVGPAGEAVPDIKRKLPGRGIWITGDPGRDRGSGQAQRVRPRLQARRAGCARSRGANRAAA